MFAKASPLSLLFQQPALILALDNIFKCKDHESVLQTLTSLYNAINNMVIPVPFTFAYTRS